MVACGIKQVELRQIMVRGGKGSGGTEDCVKREFVIWESKNGCV